MDGEIWMAVRVAERPPVKDGILEVPVLQNGDIHLLHFDSSDPAIDTTDPRVIRSNGRTFLTTLSHLRLFRSIDGISFVEADLPPWIGTGPDEAFGIEDCRVATMQDGAYLVSYTAVSIEGHGVGLRVTRDWREFSAKGMILPPANKDCAIFEERIEGEYFCLHRPSGVVLGSHSIWVASSPDLVHWGRHRFLAGPRSGGWDSARVGAGAAPIRTDRGWLVIYHGADENHRYCLGALLLDLREPWKVVGRSIDPIMEPSGHLEEEGFFGKVVFTNGHVLDGDKITIYYGAADTWICGADFSICEILSTIA